MAAIAIKDLPASRVLDGRAMSSIRGGESWVNGRFVPFTALAQVSPSLMPAVINLYQSEYKTFIADQMNLTFQIVDVRDSSNVNVGLDAKSSNLKNIK